MNKWIYTDKENKSTWIAQAKEGLYLYDETKPAMGG